MLPRIALLTLPLTLALVALALLDASSPTPATESSSPDVEPVVEPSAPSGTTTRGRRKRRAARSSEESALEEESASLVSPRLLGLRLVHPDGRPAVGYALESAEGAGAAYTDADGQVAEAWESARLTGFAEGPRFPLTPDGHTAVVPAPIPIRVRLVDARSGTALHAPRLRLYWRAEDVSKPRRVDLDSSGRATLPVLPGTRVRLRLGPHGIHGFAPDGRGDRFVRISRYAEELIWTVPLHPTVRVTVRLTDRSGSPTSEAGLGWVGLQDGTALHDVELRPGTAKGEYVFSGLPAIPGARLSARISASTGLIARIEDVPLDRGDRIVDAPATSLRPGPFRSGGSASGCVPAGPPPPVENGGRLSVQVLRKDGRPASFAWIEMSDGLRDRTDADGRFETYAYAGAVTIRIAEPGLVPTTLETRFPDTGTRQVTLREDTGGTVELVVVDPRGFPVPAARVHASDHDLERHVQWDGAAQRVELTTDTLGRLTLTGVPTKGLRLDIRSGGRNVLAETQRSGALRVVLPD